MRRPENRKTQREGRSSPRWVVPPVILRAAFVHASVTTMATAVAASEAAWASLRETPKAHPDDAASPAADAADDAAASRFAPLPENEHAARAVELCRSLIDEECRAGAAFGSFVLVCIVVAGVLVGVQTYPQLERDRGLAALDSTILAVFSLEVCVRRSIDRETRVCRSTSRSPCVRRSIDRETRGVCRSTSRSP